MPKTALVIVDLQNDYFSTWENAKWPLVDTDAAAKHAADLLHFFRENNLLVVHIRHEATGNVPFFLAKTDGAEIHQSVAPLADELVVVKQHANSFHETNLHQVLEAQHITDLVIVGAMTQNCIDHTVRAAVDLGYKCSVADDACTTRDLEYKGETIAAKTIHTAFMAALGFAYAKIDSADNLIIATAQKLGLTPAVNVGTTGTSFFKPAPDKTTNTADVSDAATLQPRI